MQFQATALMFTKRHWKILSFGLASFVLALAFSFLGALPKAIPGKAQAIAMPDQHLERHSAGQHSVGQPAESRGELAVRSPQVDDLLSFLPLAEKPSQPHPEQRLAQSESVSLDERSPRPSTKANPLKASIPRIIKTKFGHFPYAEANPEELRLAGHYGSRPERLHQDAASAYQTMFAAARQEGVHLITISGFRETWIQAELFAAQTARQGSEALAARISAPPGHSEHHTGYAIDIGDDGYPNTDLEVSFEQTPAFRWLATNANRFGFELSFPRGNHQGVMYEPWHWRFVGTAQAGEIFAQANGQAQLGQ